MRIWSIHSPFTVANGAMEDWECCNYSSSRRLITAPASMKPNSGGM
ncbi:hypothetical protein GALL_165480 [mine drainage metagenome]|uniref:Uncharacterized protein n=1 Tax=mine drainage metagenome TaxID=410659 RepID=A0A1J5RZ78_9ZZZZ